MKIECTAAEFQTMTNILKVEQLLERYEVARSDHESIVRELEEQKQILREKLEQVESELSTEKWNNTNLRLINDELREKQTMQKTATPDLSGKLAELIKVSALYFAHKSIPNADALRKALDSFFPGLKIPQIKIMREVANCGLKEAKDFVDGEASWIPSPACDNDSSDDIPF